jgi:hypothetical protein
MQFLLNRSIPAFLPVLICVFLAPSKGIASTPPNLPNPASITLTAVESDPSPDASSKADTNALTFSPERLPAPLPARLPDAPQPQTAATPGPATATPQPGSPKQTKRILFIVPNFRSVSADEKLPPTTTREKFKIAVEDSFDYSAFAEVAILAGLDEGENSVPQFHEGAAGYGRYYWHSFADNTDGDFLTEFIVPTVTREDPRYYTLGHGSVMHRAVYSVSRLVITRNNQGNPTPNFSEIAGNGAAAGISGLYYPSSERDWTKTGQRWVLQVGIDGLSNLLKEFWPDINAELFHDKY